MRLVKVQVPAGKGDAVAQLAFAIGIAQVTIRQEQVYRPDQSKENKDVVDIEAATPMAKAFIDAVLAAPFFDPARYAITVRQPRSIVSREPLAALTPPLVVPTIDLCEELWQFSHITFGFLGRVVLAAALLAYGMIEDKLLIMIAGLLFMPLLPLLLAMSLGVWTREWRLALQAGRAFVVALVLLVAAGAFVASITGPPLRYNETNSLLTSLVISLAVGVAAGLATADDVGRREMIGLAAVAQIAILPTWFGIRLVFGAAAEGSTPAGARALALLVNMAAILVAALGTYALLGLRAAKVGSPTEGRSIAEV
jgi:hypothetical protein